MTQAHRSNFILIDPVNMKICFSESIQNVLNYLPQRKTGVVWVYLSDREVTEQKGSPAN